MTEADAREAVAEQHDVSFAEATRMWARIGLLSFGGPAGQIALMHRELVEQRGWICETRFLHALNYCMVLPGPEAQQLAIYIGWLLHRTWGGVVAGVLFVLPGALVILALSMLYARFHGVAAVAALFFGLKAAVLAVVVEALIRVAKRALNGRFFYGIAAAAFIALFVFQLPFPIVIAIAWLVGAGMQRVRPALFAAQEGQTAHAEANSVVDRLFATGRLAHANPNTRRALLTFVVWGALWLLPMLALVLWRGTESVHVQQGVFFSQAAVVTFGGAYSVLAYVAQRAVDDFGWLRPGEMLDGLGLAETTPGPLILVLQFVAYLGAYRDPAELGAVASGLLGAGICLWVTFVPCFLWIFLGAPYIEALRSSKALSAGLKCITAAVVGVILNLSVWFALHVLFARLDHVELGPARLDVPVMSTLDEVSALIAIGALIALVRFKVAMPIVLASGALLGFVYRMAI